jgi:hypothetical protein
VVAAAEGQRVTLREALRRTRWDAAFGTPYTSWTTKYRLVEPLLLASFGIAAYVVVIVILQIQGVVPS